MPEYLTTGLFFLAAGIAASWAFRVNKRAGRAVIRHWSMPDDKLAYWLQQGLFGMVAAGCFISAFFILTRLTPP